MMVSEHVGMTECNKLLIISDVNIDSGFGKENFVYEMAKEFCTSHIVTILEPTVGFKKNNFNTELSSIGVSVEFYENLPGTLIPVKFRSFKKFVRIIREQNIIYLAEGDPFSDILLKILVNSKNTKLFRGYHNPMTYDIFPNGKRISKISIRRLYYKLILIFEKSFNGVHVENTDQLRELVKRGYTNVVILPPSIEIPKFESTSEKFEKFSVLFLGRLNYHKGSDQIPYLIKEICSNILSIDIYIAGEGILSEKIKQYCQRFDNCHFLGFITISERNLLLAKCHVLLAPTRVEAFMLTGIEAMARGTPVISYKVPGPNDYVEEGLNGYLADNCDDMLKKIKKIYEEFNDGNYEKYRENCLKTALNYSTKNRIGSYANLVRQLVKSR